MRRSHSPFQFLLFLLLLVILFTLVQVGLVHIAADKLGVRLPLALLALFFCLMSSFVNIPLFSIPSHKKIEQQVIPVWLLGKPELIRNRILVAINLGGAVMPLFFCIYLYNLHQLSFVQILLVTLGVALPSYVISRPIPGLGVAMPVFIPPIIAALLALLLAPEQSAPLAYIGGTLGVILGADVLRLRSIQDLGAPIVSIGGAGTFDGVFLTGIIAVLLA
jgi:uncharacterized membrane protein